MSIKSDTYYNSLRIYDDRFELVSQIDGNLNGDYVAGLISALYIYAHDTNTNYTADLDSYEINLDDIDNLLYDYISGHDFIYNVNKYNPPGDDYGLWVLDTKNKSSETRNNHYYLFTFFSTDFISGFIAMFDIFNKDFRYYLISPPFKFDYELNQTIKFGISGYDLEDFDKDIAFPAFLTPYYTLTYETDPFGVDFG